MARPRHRRRSRRSAARRAPAWSRSRAPRPRASRRSTTTKLVRQRALVERCAPWRRNGVLHLLMRVVMPTALFGDCDSPYLAAGSAAVWLTGIVLALGLAGWIVRHTVGYVPAAFHSAATVALPWALTLAQVGVNPGQEFWTYHIVLVGLWFVHNWGEGRLLRSSSDLLGICLLAVSDLGMALLLVVAARPFWLALMSVLWLPRLGVLIYQKRPLQRLNFWWLLGMLISGLALGQSLNVL